MSQSFFNHTHVWRRFTGSFVQRAMQRTDTLTSTAGSKVVLEVVLCIFAWWEAVQTQSHKGPAAVDRSRRRVVPELLRDLKEEFIAQ